MKYSAIIFDMDGTIIDTNGIWEEATLSFLRDRGINCDSNQTQTLLSQLHGVSLPNACTLLKTTYELPEPIDHLIVEKKQRAHTLYTTHLQFIEGFQEFHQITQRTGLSTGIATNATKDTLELTDQVLNLRQFFGDHLYSIDHVERIGKPHPAIYLFVANQLNISPDQCIAIEDSACGIAAAKAAGMFCIGINTSKNPQQLAQADLIINSYEELDLFKI